MNLEMIQKAACERVMKSLLVRAIIEAKVTREQYRSYMVDVYHYACHSSQVIGMAAVRLVTSHPEMATYLFRHAEEELGHDKWAASDLRDLGMSDQQIATSHPSNACLEMLGLEYLYAGHFNPVGLFGWMFTLESLGAQVASQVAKKLNETLSLGGRGLYFLTGHGEADKDHSADLTRVISVEVKSAEDIAVFQRMARISCDSYVRILDAAASPL